ncbi:hypothetical protein L6452_00010 [Arctium lappa]|uniref:Uncharacterized protein n=1 Tax=Arctium lappa TaxID=4217 RepID=A0ACB9FC86_ARCLA|nr:hypothetical protein L6452_00010 [Arctium lappa]
MHVSSKPSPSYNFDYTLNMGRILPVLIPNALLAFHRLHTYIHTYIQLLISQPVLISIEYVLLCVEGVVHAVQCKMRMKKSSLVKVSTHYISQQPNSYEGESLHHLLNSIQREIKLARLSDESLPQKIWLKQQFCIGVNDVSRVLERMPPVSGSSQNATSRNAKAIPLQLQAILLATDCNPGWLTKHLSCLASSREVPVIFVKDKKGGSFKLGEMVNLKTAMAIGVKARGNAINQLIAQIYSS